MTSSELLRSASLGALIWAGLSGCSVSSGALETGFLDQTAAPDRDETIRQLAELDEPAPIIAGSRIRTDSSAFGIDIFDQNQTARLTQGYAARIASLEEQQTAPPRYATAEMDELVLASVGASNTAATSATAASANNAASNNNNAVISSYADRVARVSARLEEEEQMSVSASQPSYMLATLQDDDTDSTVRRPGRPAPGTETIDLNDGAVPPPSRSELVEEILPVPDRWRLAANLGVVKHSLLNPYGQNTLKGDRPIKGTKDWFFAGSLISDTIIEPRSFPVPVSPQTSERPDTLDVFGDNDSLVLAQTVIAQAALIKGSTAYKPQDLEFRLTAAFNYNYAEVEEKRVLFVEPSKGKTRPDGWIGIQEAFIDYHIRNVSERYDFDSLRVGIQPFSSDFRGFLFQDNQLGIRFFGNRDNNRWQYNLAGFMRLEKDTNSGLNDITVTPREDYVLFANAYRQDFPVPGMTSQGTFAYNINREKGDIQIDDNGFPVRPATFGDGRTREYDVGYLGYNADGRWRRLNLTASAYYAFGENRNSVFTGDPADIKAFFIAAEPSLDFNWLRFRLSGLYASGDKDPYDDEENGFDAIFENPQFAGADTSYYIRQTIPFAGGGRAVSLNNRNGILNALRPSKEQGQSNFANPGTILLGAGFDADVTPPLRISGSANHLWFDDTSTLQVLRNQGPSTIDESIGWDVSLSAIYRPRFIQNFVFRLSGGGAAPR